jgi:5'-nucleotidase
MEENKRPLILVTNDDGYDAKGIHQLVETVKDMGRVVVVSPKHPQSGMGHAITIHDPIHIREIKDFGDIEGYQCSGTPVDCVKMAIYSILDRRPDIILSGINHGANFSINILYSGTMSAAVEGALENIPSIGFSLLDYDADADFEASKEVVRSVVAKALKNGMPDHICLNVNIPKLPRKDLKGYRICRQGVGHWKDDFVKNHTPMGKPYFWLAGSFQDMDGGEDTDTWALENGYVSIVPVQFDMTAHQHMSTFNHWGL